MESKIQGHIEGAGLGLRKYIFGTDSPCDLGQDSLGQFEYMTLVSRQLLQFLIPKLLAGERHPEPCDRHLASLWDAQEMLGASALC